MEHKRPKFGPGEIVVLIAIGILMLVIVMKGYGAIVDWLYSPFAVVLAVVMVVEYLLLKGSDRSVIYRRERDAAREIRRDDLLALRELEGMAVDLRARIATVLEQPEEVENLRKIVAAAHQTSDEMIRVLRGRI